MSRAGQAGVPNSELQRQSSESASLEFPAVEANSIQAQNRAAFVAGFRNSSQRGSEVQRGLDDVQPEDSIEEAFQNLSVSESSAREERGRANTRSRSSYPADPNFRPWNAPNISYPVHDFYGGMRMQPGQMPGQMPVPWLPYPGMAYGMYGEPRQGLYFDSRIQGPPAFQAGFFPPHLHGPVPGQRLSAPMMPGSYYFQPQHQAPVVRQRPPRPSKAPQQSTEAYDFSVEEAEEQPETCRKTLMLRNIPNKYSIHMLLEMLDSCHGRGPGELVYDFCYLPIDFKNRCNLGYAFVNFVDAKSTLECYKTFHEKRWNDFNSKKVCEVKYGRVQGREALIEHFKNSKFPSNDTDSLPLLFEHVEKEDGTKEIRSLPLHSRHPS